LILTFSKKKMLQKKFLVLYFEYYCVIELYIYETSAHFRIIFGLFEVFDFFLIVCNYLELVIFVKQ
jgi:hypothetical protein